jgi:hypothetical protein
MNEDDVVVAWRIDSSSSKYFGCSSPVQFADNFLGSLPQAGNHCIKIYTRHFGAPCAI